MPEIQGEMSEHFQTLLAEVDSIPPNLYKTVEDVATLAQFARKVSTAISRTVRDISEGVFNNFVNVTLQRRDSYLEHLRPGIKPDTALKLRTAPFYRDLLFPDSLLNKAESEIQHYEDHRGHSASKNFGQSNRFHPYQGGGNSNNNNNKQAQYARRQEAKSQSWKESN